MRRENHFHLHQKQYMVWKEISNQKYTCQYFCGIYFLQQLYVNAPHKTLKNSTTPSLWKAKISLPLMHSYDLKQYILRTDYDANTA